LVNTLEETVAVRAHPVTTQERGEADTEDSVDDMDLFGEDG
jgi:hypothetical protein